MGKIKHLFDHWDQFESCIKDKHILLFLDYDGTLVPIAAKPQEAVLEAETKRILLNLTLNPRVTLAAVSGRSLKNLKAMIGIKRMAYVGNHGFEIEGPHIEFEEQRFPQTRKIFNSIVKKLKVKTDLFPGLLIEDKGLTLSIHYRLLAKDVKGDFDQAFDEIIKDFLRDKAIVLRKGKKVYELRPPIKWDKGTAVEWLRKEYERHLIKKASVLVYLGDDKTDEDVFKVLKDRSVAIHVGRLRSTGAGFRLKGPAEVRTFLNRLKGLL